MMPTIYDAQRAVVGRKIRAEEEKHFKTRK